MTRAVRNVLAGAILIVLLAACGKPGGNATRTLTPAQPSPRPSTSAPAPAAPQPTVTASVWIDTPGDTAKLPNPGTGTGDPKLAAALLTRFGIAEEQPRLPGAVVRLPVRDPNSLFITVRQASSPYTEPPICARWTAGLWLPLISEFNKEPGAQLAVTTLNSDINPLTSPSPTARESLTFSEAIITGSAAMLDRLAVEHAPAECARLSMAGGRPGYISLLATPKIGDHSWSYRIVDDKGYVWHWGQLVRFKNYVIEIRIPNQAPAPRGDMVELLHRAAAEAYAKAVRTLG